MYLVSSYKKLNAARKLSSMTVVCLMAITVTDPDTKAHMPRSIQRARTMRMRSLYAQARGLVGRMEPDISWKKGKEERESPKIELKQPKSLQEIAANAIYNFSTKKDREVINNNEAVAMLQSASLENVAKVLTHDYKLDGRNKFRPPLTDVINLYRPDLIRSLIGFREYLHSVGSHRELTASALHFWDHILKPVQVKNTAREIRRKAAADLERELSAIEDKVGSSTAWLKKVRPELEAYKSFQSKVELSDLNAKLLLADDLSEFQSILDIYSQARPLVGDPEVQEHLKQLLVKSSAKEIDDFEKDLSQIQKSDPKLKLNVRELSQSD